MQKWPSRRRNQEADKHQSLAWNTCMFMRICECKRDLYIHHFHRTRNRPSSRRILFCLFNLKCRSLLPIRIHINTIRAIRRVCVCVCLYAVAAVVVFVKALNKCDHSVYLLFLSICIHTSCW